MASLTAAPARITSGPESPPTRVKLPYCSQQRSSVMLEQLQVASSKSMPMASPTSCNQKRVGGQCLQNTVRCLMHERTNTELIKSSAWLLLLSHDQDSITKSMHYNQAYSQAYSLILRLRSYETNEMSTSMEDLPE
jgi:hypothetical protein